MIGVDMNYRLKKLEGRIRTAETERDEWKDKYEQQLAKSVESEAAYTREKLRLQNLIQRLKDTGAKLPRGRQAITKKAPTTGRRK